MSETRNMAQKEDRYNILVNKPGGKISIFSETNVVQFLFNLLRIKGLYMFRALIDHPQEVLHNGTWYIACLLCQLAASGLKWNWKCRFHSNHGASN
jgi:hypothetical protein